MNDVCIGNTSTMSLGPRLLKGARTGRKLNHKSFYMWASQGIKTASAGIKQMFPDELGQWRQPNHCNREGEREGGSVLLNSAGLLNPKQSFGIFLAIVLPSPTQALGGVSGKGVTMGKRHSPQAERLVVCLRSTA